MTSGTKKKKKNENRREKKNDFLVIRLIILIKTISAIRFESIFEITYAVFKSISSRVRNGF